MNKTLLVAFVAVLLLGFVGQSMAADGNVSQSTLAEMGLSGMQTMTDVQGESVRGMHYTYVSGYSGAGVRGASAYNEYYAEGNSFSAGGSISFAASPLWYAVAGGGAFAYAQN